MLTGYGLTELEQAETPLSWTVFGAHIVDEEQDMGYGPAGYNLPEQVKEISEALEALSINDLKEKYNPSKMDELGIYPNVWEGEPEAFDHLVETYKLLQEFYKTAAQNGEAVITFLN